MFEPIHDRRLSTILFFLIWMGLTAGSAAQSVNLPLEHWAYELLDRFQTRGLIRDHRSFIRPFSREQIALMLTEAQKRINRGTRISAPEAALFEQLKGEFHRELSSLNVKTDPRFDERHLLTWETGNRIVHADLDCGQSVDFRSTYTDRERTAAVSRTTLGGFLRGHFLENFSFLLYVKNTLIKGEPFESERFDPSQGPPIILSGKNAYTDDASAYLVWKGPWFRIAYGRDRVRWGPGLLGNLTLSANNPRFSMFKLDLHTRAVRFSSLHGKLHSGQGEKYLAAHRLEVGLFPWLIAGWSETVVYGNRPAEPLYLNPLMIYHIAEHHLGDRDNNTMSFDVAAFPFPGHRFYGELFIDDFTLSRNPFTYFGNKFALLAGWQWTAPFGLERCDLRVEAARIEPYVYTHTDSINVYSNYNRSLGHWLEPNSDDIRIRFNTLLHRDVSVTLLSARTRSGEGDLETPHDASKGDRKRFLSGTVETRRTWGVEFRGQLIRDVFFTFQYHNITTKRAAGESSGDSKEHRFWFDLAVNY